MPTPWQLECLQERFNSLEREIKRVQAKYHPYSEPDAIFRALLLALDSQATHLRTSRRLFETKPHILHEIFEDVVRDVQNVFSTLDLAERVDSSRIPFELLRALSWASQDLLKEECRTVVRLHTAYNYTVTSCRRWFTQHGWGREWSQATGRTGEDVPVTVLVLGFPSPDVSSTLLHVIAAHELGHEVLWLYGDRFAAVQADLLEEAKLQHRELLKEYIVDNSRRREGVPQADAYSESSNAMDASLLAISRSWLTEIWADLVAARLVGPASLAALDRISIEPCEPRETHPPGSLRREMIKHYLEREFPHIASDGVWTPVLQTHKAPSIRKTTSAATPLFKVVESVCSASLNRLIPMLHEIPSPLLDPDLISGFVKDMRDYIDHLCPPNQCLPPRIANTSASAWLLMYGFWHYRLSSQFQEFCRKLRRKDGELVGESILGNLLLHALHSAELSARWANRANLMAEAGDVSAH